MKPIRRLRRYAFLLLSTTTLAALPGWADDDTVIAVLSSNLAPYQQALEGFQDAFGKPIKSFVLSDGEPQIFPETKVIVAFGGKAALHSYPSSVLLIYSLAPGIRVVRSEGEGGLFHVHTNASVPLTISNFKMLQPSLKRLAMLWAGDAIQDLADQKRAVARSLGVEIISDRIRDPADLPDHLRALKGKVDAIWMPADATMVTPQNFATIKQFCLSNALPFYVPSDGLVEQGATASVNSSFRDMGKLAAQTALRAQAGSLNTDQAYPESIHVTVNMSASKICGLRFSPDVIKKIDRVIQ